MQRPGDKCGLESSITRELALWQIVRSKRAGLCYHRQLFTGLNNIATELSNMYRLLFAASLIFSLVGCEMAGEAKNMTTGDTDVFSCDPL